MSDSNNANFNFNDVGVVSSVRVVGHEVVTSAEIDERLEPFYERVGARPGVLDLLAGVHERRQWNEGFSFADASAAAGEEAIRAAGVDRRRIGLLIDSSVCRARLEPSTAVTVHHMLGLSPTCMNYDVSNACLGFLNGIHLAGIMIESGQIDYALVVDGEGTREIHDNTIDRLNNLGETAEDLSENFASLTLGSGAAAMVIGRHSANPGSHAVLKGFFRAESRHHELCVGSLENMRTDTRALLDAGTELAKVAWDYADPDDWLDMDRYILHQVSKVHHAAMIDVLGINPERTPLTFPTFGNIGPAAIPFTLAHYAHTLTEGDRVLCLGIGSGLNAGVLELVW
jgi:3-oxoacyl-[acyl-carrier-protein] synthase-3